MSSICNSSVELLTGIPARERTRIVSGMRWTAWLSVLAIPFSLGTATLLAWLGPAAVGTFGLLTVYIGLVTAFFYLGGDAVVIKFIPEMEAGKRLRFLTSYYAIICLWLMPYLVAAALWPEVPRYFLGKAEGEHLPVLLLCLSPIHILFSMVTAGLKGTLEIRWSQGLLRMVTIVSFVLYASLFVYGREFLRANSGTLIWGIYLSLAALGSGIGLWRLSQLHRWRSISGLHFFLPRGFWRYAIATQQVGLVWFLLQRLDYILLLNLGGLDTLGRYVTVVTIVSMITMCNSFFLDTLLPSLTNMIAERNDVGSAAVLSLHMRILFIVNAATTFGIILLAGWVTASLGPNYDGLRPSIVLLALLLGLAAPGAVGGTLLSSVGMQQRAVWVGLIQLVVFGGLFYALFPRWGLTGAVIAYGLSMLAGNILLLTSARRTVPFDSSIFMDYTRFAFVASLTALLAARFDMGPLAALLAWAAALGVFLILARYRSAECMALAHCFLPAQSDTRIARDM